MEDIFDKENEVIREAERLIKIGAFHSDSDQKNYTALLNSYRQLLKQMKTLVRMSDIMQSKLSTLTNDLEILSQIDGLTGLYNRRHVNNVYQEAWEVGLEDKTPLGILMIDIDYFKKYNDTFGHLEGDFCLQKIAVAIAQVASEFQAIAGRFGGEEFILIFPETKESLCRKAAELVLSRVKGLQIESPIEGAPVTVSVGIGCAVPNGSMKPEQLIDFADQALYRAKADGRDCYRI